MPPEYIVGIALPHTLHSALKYQVIIVGHKGPNCTKVHVILMILLTMNMLNLTQNKLVVEMVTFLLKRPMRGQYVFIMAKSRAFYMFYIFNYYVWRLRASYFLEMNMLISLKCTLTQTRMGLGRVALHRKGPMRGQYVFLMAKSQTFDRLCIHLLVLKTTLQFLEMIMLISFVEDSASICFK